MISTVYFTSSKRGFVIKYPSCGLRSIRDFLPACQFTVSPMITMIEPRASFVPVSSAFRTQVPLKGGSALTTGSGSGAEQLCGQLLAAVWPARATTKSPRQTTRAGHKRSSNGTCGCPSVGRTTLPTLMGPVAAASMPARRVTPAATRRRSAAAASGAASPKEARTAPAVVASGVCTAARTATEPGESASTMSAGRTPWPAASATAARTSLSKAKAKSGAATSLAWSRF
mmetsp:Transcript_52257/g.144714  ORF Transcript_52257/g.144714 Transcript_52257/m.144714 type:complete len:229 (+) Transcript_52257:322-1008(+)